VATSVPEQPAEPLLRDLVRAIGLSHVVYLLAHIADEREQVARSVGDEGRARRYAHDGRVLGEAAIRLLE
jgi:hypothetical protein